MKKKKCKYWRKRERKGTHCRLPFGTPICPEDADGNCNLLHSPVPKTARIKAWAYSENVSECIKEGGLIIYFGKRLYEDEIPCTILIDRKYLKEKKI